MDVKPDFNRISLTVRHQEPDRVPLMDAAISYEIMSRFLGRPVLDSDVEAQADFFLQAGYDYVPLTAGMMQPGKVTDDSAISKVMYRKIVMDGGDSSDDDAWNLEKQAAIHDERDFDAFPWADAVWTDSGKFHQIQQFLPDNMKIVALSGKIFTLSWMLMGYENFCVNLMLEPDFVKRVIDRVACIQFDALKVILDIPNVGAVWAVDDLAFGTGTIIKPDDLRQYIFPWYKKFAQACHEKGILFLFHSDGVLWDILEDLIGLGVDALHPIDPTCMDIDAVKSSFGQRLCLIGNISNELLHSGSPEDVAQLTKKRIRTLAPGGGYCVGSGNSVPEWAQIENYRAMVETTLKYGNYPISIMDV